MKNDVELLRGLLQEVVDDDCGSRQHMGDDWFERCVDTLTVTAKD